MSYFFSACLFALQSCNTLCITLSTFKVRPIVVQQTATAAGKHLFLVFSIYEFFTGTKGFDRVSQNMCVDLQGKYLLRQRFFFFIRTKKIIHFVYMFCSEIDFLGFFVSSARDAWRGEQSHWWTIIFIFCSEKKKIFTISLISIFRK